MEFWWCQVKRPCLSGHASELVGSGSSIWPQMEGVILHCALDRRQLALLCALYQLI